MGKRKCSVKDCPSSEHRPEDEFVTFHKLPMNPINRQVWLDLCKIDQDHKLLFVCSKHFYKVDFANYKTKIQLKQRAIPSIFSWKPAEKTVELASRNTVTEAPQMPILTNGSSSVLLQNKRIRKKKVNPDFVTSFKHGKEAVECDNTSLAKSTDDETIQSEDSTSLDLPPVLEPVLPTPSETDGDSEIPNLEPSLVEKPVKNSLPSLKNKKKLKKAKLLAANSQTALPGKKKKFKHKTRTKATPRPKTPVLTTPVTTLSEPLSPNQSIIKDRIIVQNKCSPAPTTSKTNVELSPVQAVNSNLVSTSSTSIGQVTFEPNARIEALDINQTWSPATILEVDYEENEVLVHFDSLSNKYDEWIGINSSSIRTPIIGGELEEAVTPADLQEPAADTSIQEVKASYNVGERCMAYWGAKRKFPATVTEIIDPETYVVKFDDGYILQMHVSKMTKASQWLDPVKSSKQDRRNKKRKLNVQSLFAKRHKSKPVQLETSVTDDCSSADESAVTNEGAGFFDKDKIWYPTFENGVPIGIVSSLKSKAGTRMSYIVPDPNLPPNWEKHVVQREGGKFFSVIVTDEDKKLRSPSDIQRYIQEHPQFKFQDYRLDFNVIPRNSRGLYAAKSRERSAPQDRKILDVVEREHENTPHPSSKSDALKIVQVDGVYTCPIDGCSKIFRRENLVQMHVKHYHPEFTKFLDSTPNVLDLVYQRLHGEEFEHTLSSRSYEHPKRGSFTPLEELRDQHEVDYAKDSELKKLLNSTPVDPSSTETCSPGSSSIGTANDYKSRNGVESGLDLKALVVTTKSGLKTIPPVKKEIKEEVESRKRKAEDALEDTCEVDGIEQEQQHSVPLQAPQPVLDHIIGEDGKVIKIEHMRKEEIIHCTCGITEEDGLMIQCEICMCWQHAHCNNIYLNSQVPEKYICFICQNPQGQRSSMKYKQDQDWLKHGNLPTGSYHCRDKDALNKKFDDLRTSHDISGGLLELKDYMHTLKQKIKIAKMKDHPKLYLWSKPWEKTGLPEKKPKEEIKEETDSPAKENEINDIEDEKKCEQSSAPQPEAPIETADCRINLLEHILHCQSLISLRLEAFSKEIDALDGSTAVDDSGDDRMRMTTNMLVRDLGKLKELSQLI